MKYMRGEWPKESVIMTNEKNRGLKNMLKIFQYGFRKGHGTKRFNCSTDGAYLKGV